jgi:chorismate synthase
MKIEQDSVTIASGVRWGETIGSPLALIVKNRDWENWQEKMSPLEKYKDDKIRITRSRPGHADLAGVMKYGQKDVRNILERSSARESAIRVAVGAVAKSLLNSFGIKVFGYVVALGGIIAESKEQLWNNVIDAVTESELYTCDKVAENRMKKLIDKAKESGDTVGGIIEVRVVGVPAGLGSHAHWDRKIDARLAMAVMSIQAIKAVEIGMGFESASRPGSQVHDEIFYDSTRLSKGEHSGFYRKTNNAGGIEGGISNGEDIVVRAAMKPIPTLYKPLKSVDLSTKESVEATVERSDICAVPAATVVAEAVVAFEIASAFLEKFGGDSIAELKRNYNGYIEDIKTL